LGCDEKIRLTDDVLVADKVGFGRSDLGRRFEGALSLKERRMNDDAAAQRYRNIVGLLVGSNAVAMMENRTTMRREQVS
jgi:hypothetical protein